MVATWWASGSWTWNPPLLAPPLPPPPREPLLPPPEEELSSPETCVLSVPSAELPEPHAMNTGTRSETPKSHLHPACISSLRRVPVTVHAIGHVPRGHSLVSQYP